MQTLSMSSTQACCPRLESQLHIHVTRVGHTCHNLCNPHHWTPGRFKIILMHRHTCKSLLTTFERAVEQLAGCLAKQAKSQQSRSKYNSHANTSGDRFKANISLFTQWHQVTPIVPPTGCGIRPVPNRNLLNMGRTKFTTSGAHDVIAITSPQKNNLCTEKLRDRAKTKSLDEVSLPLRKARFGCLFLGRDRGLWS